VTSDNRDPDGTRAFVDYEVEENQLYKSLAKGYLTRGDSLEYLSYAGLSSMDPDSKLPS
jgi:hypothetical protein